MRNALFRIALSIGLLAGAPSLAEATNYLDEAQHLEASGQLRAAEIELKNAVRTDQSNMTAHYRLAVIQLRLGEAAAAEHEASVARAGGYDPEKVVPVLLEAYLMQKKYRELLQDFPATSGSPALRAGELVARGYAQLSLQRPDDAKASFDLAQQLAPKAPQPVLAEAKMALERHDLASAETLFDRVLTLSPNSNEALVGKATVMQEKGDNAKALSLLSKAIAGSPDYAPARLARAQILMSEHKDAEAKADVDAVRAAQPLNGGAIYMEVLFAVKKADYQKADAELQKISGMLAVIPRGYYVQALVQYNLHELDQAADSARRYAARYPDDMAGAKLLGLIELSLGHASQTVDTLSKFSSNGKADVGALDLLGRAYAQLGRTSDALATFDKAVKLAPKNAALQMRLGATELRAGDTADAVKDLETSLDLAPSPPAAEMLVMTDLGAGRWQSAADAATRLQKAEPQSPIPGNLLGLVALAQFDLPAADNQFSDLAKKYPNYIPARLNLAQVDALQGKSGEAADLLQGILAKEPTNGVALTRLVNLLLRDKKNDAAIAVAEKAHSAAPSNPAITAGLVDLYLRLGHKDQALALARLESGEDTPATFPLILARARAEFATGFKTEGVQTFHRLLIIAPQRADLRVQYASALLASGDKDGARQALDEALRILPDNPQVAAARLQLALRTGGLDAGLATAADLEKNNPTLPNGPALDGDAYLSVGKFDQAADSYSKAFQHSPSALLALRLARAKAAGGHSDAAMAVLRDWLAKNPGDITVAAALGNDELNAHQYNDAKNQFQLVLSRQPQNVIALNDLAWLYQRTGDPNARRFAERAYLLAPALAQTADTLGWILVQQGQAAEGIGLLKQASAEQKADGAIQYHLAVAFNDLGNPKEAIALLTPLLKGQTKFDDKPAAEKLYAELSKK